MNNQPKKPKMQGKHAAHRDAVLRTLVLELIRNERLQSTPSKIKLLKQKFDRLVTQAKKGTDSSKRKIGAYLRNEKAEQKLYTKLLPRFESDTSGYALTARTLPRKGDNAAQMIIMLKGAEIGVKKTKLQKELEKQTEKRNKKGKAKK